MRRSPTASITKLAAALFVLAFASSCTLTMAPEGISAGGDLDEFQGTYMTTFDILNGTFISSDRALTPFGSASTGTQPRATVPTWGTTSYDLPDSVGETRTGTQADYPEPGQTSSWVVEKLSTDYVFSIKVTTTFPDYDPRLKQEEWYYIHDIAAGDGNAIGTWTNDDPISTPTGVDDAKYRSKNELTFRDDSVQTETIVDVTNRFAAFDIDGSLEYPQAFAPAADASATWSSVVVYTREYADSPSFSFWSGNRVRAIVGVRFYTEHLTEGDTKLVGSTLVFEKAATTLNTEDGDVIDPASGFFMPDIAAEPDQAYLALSVVRQEIVYDYDAVTQTPDYSNAVRDTRTKTRVVNIATQQDNYVEIINDEAAAITSAYDTLWIPSGSELSVVNLDTAVTVNTKTENTAISTTDSEPVAIVTDTPISDLGTLYAAINGAPLETVVTDDIAGDLLDTAGNRIVSTYNGKQGTLLDTDAYDFHVRGTVQAWVNVKKTTSYPGIVHAGIRSDFADEIWSLQFWNTNTPAFGLSANSGSSYDIVQSNQKLNLGSWYHIVATWDLGTNSMKIYVNGVETGSRGFSNISMSSSFATGSPVVIGSQFYDGTKTLNKYYGLNGKVNGVIIDERVWSAAEIAAFYDANKDKTASW
ncbi:MAG: LamG domain-containing protein [Spirochaetales bacterium]|nr:LamG domain-containing protein [Spirochaetales bacterium]